MTGNNIKGVFFDFHETLFVTRDLSQAWEIWFDKFAAIFENHGLELARPALRDKCHGLFASPIRPDERKGLSVYETRIDRLARELDIRLSPGQIHAFADETVECWHRQMYLDPDAGLVLGELNYSRVVALVSNFDHPSQIHALLDSFGLRKYFRAVVISGEVGYDKPDPRIFQIALERSALKPEEVIHVGDSPEDVLGAIRAGIRPVYLRRDPGGAVGRKGGGDFPPELAASIESEGVRSRIRIISRLSEIIKLA